MSVAWAQVEALIRSNRNQELVDLLASLEDGDRKPLVAPVRALSRSQDSRGFPAWDLFAEIALVGAAVLPDAKTVASWIRRFAQHDSDTQDAKRRDSHAGDLATVLIARDPVWLPNLVTQLAEQLRHDAYASGPYRLIERLRVHLEAAPPRGAGYVAGWVHFGWRDTDLVTLLHADPRFADLVPLVVENDDVAGLLRGTQDTPGHVRLVIDALDAGLADRGAVLDSLLARFQRGGRPGPTNDFVAVHEAFAPSLDEVVQRRRDYLALLPAPSASTVAGMAQGHLLAALAADRLTINELAEVSRSVLTRGDKKLVRAQLAALRDHARRSPADLSRLAEMTTTIFDNAAPDLQRDGVKLLAAWLPSLDADTTNLVLERASALPADLAAVLGTTHVSAPAPVLRLAFAEPTRVERIETPEELIEELLLVLRSEGWKIAALAVDRILEATPRLAGDNLEALRRAAQPVLSSDPYRWAHTHHEYGSNWTLPYGLVALLDAALGTPVRLSTYGPSNASDRVPQKALTTRVYAAAKALHSSSAVRSVSLPSWSDGTIEASELRERLVAADTEGWTPDPTDLEQAILRVAPDQAAAIGLTSPPAPLTSFVERKERHFSSWDGDRPPPPVYVPIPVLTPHPDDVNPGVLWSLLRSLPAPNGDYMIGYDSGSTFQAWPLIVPHHADLIAAHRCLAQVDARDHSSDETGVLIGVASAPGPSGPGLYAAIAYGLGAKKADRQAAAVDALLVLAARNRLDGDALGSILGRIVTQRGIVLKRLFAPLTDLAHSGAAKPTWDAVRTVLEAAIALTPTPSGMPDLLSTAAEIASLAGAHEPVPGLADLAARKGTSRQLVEARRLLAILS